MTCIRCGLDLPLDSFTRDKRHKDGYLRSCKECNKPKSYIYVETKICSKCGETKPRNAFGKSSRSRYGLKETCTDCEKARGKAYREAMKNRTDLPVLTEKRCFDCEQVKPVSEFYRSRHRKDGYTENCIECREKRRKAHEKIDPDVYKNRWKRYYAIPENVEKKRLQSKKYRQENPEEARANSKRAYERKKEYYNSYAKAWYKTEKGLALVKKKHAVRRVRMGDEKITAAQIREIEQANREKYGIMTCVYCLSPIDGSYHLEHRIPLSRGGKNKKDNLTISCPSCNVRKHNKTDAEFLALMGSI